jgi:predicted transcriptional regulator
MTDLQREQIRALRGEGRSYREIAGFTGISKETVKTFCRRNAISAVTASEETTHNDPMHRIADNGINTFCKHCEKPLIKIRNTKKFCSDACRLAHHKANRTPTAVCSHCGALYNNRGSTARKYCSFDCYIASRFPYGDTNKEAAL